MTKARNMAGILKSVVDPSSPWKLPLREFESPGGSFKMTATEWALLLNRAKRGDAEAQWSIAEAYFDGCSDKAGRILAKRSARKGREWLQRAAENGCASAQNNLGILIGNGKGFDKDPRKSLVWLKKAFRGKESGTAINIAISHRETGNFRLAVFWFRKGVSLVDDSARIQLGIHYYWGIGVRRNFAAAIRCFRRAINGKNLSEADREDACFYLGIAHLEGKGVKASVETARDLLRKANVDNDHPAARAVLSVL